MLLAHARTRESERAQERAKGEQNSLRYSFSPKSNQKGYLGNVCTHSFELRISTKRSVFQEGLVFSHGFRVYILASKTESSVTQLCVTLWRSNEVYTGRQEPLQAQSLVP